MRQRGERFLKSFFGGLGHCVLEDLGSAVPVAACVFVVCFLYIFFYVGYELLFDPNAADIAARLAAMSISPEKLM